MFREGAAPLNTMHARRSQCTHTHTTTTPLSQTHNKTPHNRRGAHVRRARVYRRGGRQRRRARDQARHQRVPVRGRVWGCCVCCGACYVCCAVCCVCLFSLAKTPPPSHTHKKNQHSQLCQPHPAALRGRQRRRHQDGGQAHPLGQLQDQPDLGQGRRLRVDRVDQGVRGRRLFFLRGCFCLRVLCLSCAAMHDSPPLTPAHHHHHHSSPTNQNTTKNKNTPPVRPRCRSRARARSISATTCRRWSTRSRRRSWAAACSSRCVLALCVV